METDNLNLLILTGRLAMVPERVHPGGLGHDGPGTVRLLVTVRTDNPRRVEVLPVEVPEPDTWLWDNAHTLGPGQRMWIAGRVTRRYHNVTGGARSAITLVAEQVIVRGEPLAATG